MHIERITLKPVDISHVVNDFEYAFLEFYQIRHLRPSFVVHIFFNRDCPEMFDIEEPSYAGSFSVFGHPVCAGSAGHCSSNNQIRRFDKRPSKHMIHAFRRASVSLKLQEWIDEQKKELPISLLVMSNEDWPNKTDKKLLHMDAVKLVTG